MKKQTLYTKEFAAPIIDLFEDFLDKKGVRIENPERDADDPDNTTNIWGEDFDELVNDISGTIKELVGTIRPDIEIDDDSFGESTVEPLNREGISI